MTPLTGPGFRPCPGCGETRWVDAGGMCAVCRRIDEGKEVSTHETVIAQPIHVTLTRNTKGFSFEVSVHAATVEEALQLTQQAEAELSAKYSKVE